MPTYTSVTPHNAANTAVFTRLLSDNFSIFSMLIIMSLIKKPHPEMRFNNCLAIVKNSLSPFQFIPIFWDSGGLIISH